MFKSHTPGSRKRVGSCHHEPLAVVNSSGVLRNAVSRATMEEGLGRTDIQSEGLDLLRQSLRSCEFDFGRIGLSK